MIEYSQDKLDMLPILSNLFAKPEEELLRIQGPAGCGKTTVMQMIVKHYLSFFKLQQLVNPETKSMSSSNIFLTATTNKAASVIEQEVCLPLEGELGTLSCGTIYSFLGLKVFNDYSTGETKVAPNKKGGNPSLNFAKNTLVVIDEVSYIDNLLWKYIVDGLLGRGLKIILIGDFYQTTPVNCRCSPVFEWEMSSYVLTERFRYPNNSAIHLNSLNFEKAVDTGQVSKMIFDSTCEHITSKDLPSLIKEHFVDNNNFTRILAHKNQTVVSYNREIATLKYGCGDFHVGQDVISNRFYHIGMGKNIYNEQLLTIKEIHSNPEDCLLHGVEYLTVTFTNGVYGKVPKKYSQYRQALKQAKSTRDWHTFYEIQESLLDLRYAWASTIHKSQGSTYDYCILDFNDMGSINNMLLFYRLLNVAVTRPRIKVFICKD